MLTAVITCYDNVGLHVLPSTLYVHLIKTYSLVSSNANILFFLLYIFNTSRNQQCFVGSHMPVSGYIKAYYTGQASMDMDISMDIHAKSVDMDMDMDMDGKFHIHGNPDAHTCTYDRSQQKPINNFEKSSRGRSQGLPKMLRASIYI